MKVLKIAIIGGGNGALTMAGDLSIRGHEVRLYEDPQFFAKLGDIRTEKTIKCTGLFNGVGKLYMVTDCIEQAIKGVDYIAVVTPATTHKLIAQKLKGLVTKDQHVLIYPGAFGALIFKTVLGDDCPVILQTNNLPYDTRISGPSTVFCSGMSPVSVAIFPSDADQSFLEDIAVISAYDKVYTDVLECGLSLVNPSVHSGPCLINIGAIEQQKLRGNFCMYEHFTFGAAKIDVEIDKERKAVGKAFGYKLCPLEDFTCPKGEEVTWQDIYQKMHGAPELTPIIGPDSIWNRYLTEDCPCGLVPWSELGRIVGVPTPTMDAVIQVYSLVHERNWRELGIHIQDMGFENLDIEQIKDYLKSGIKPTK